MHILYKTQNEIISMRRAAQIAASILTELSHLMVPGISTLDIDEACKAMISSKGAVSAAFRYQGYPAHVCTSVNHVACHGLPNNRPLKTGDIVNVDIAVIKDGMCGDTSKMFCIGEASILANRLIQTTYECMWLGIQAVKPGNRLLDIATAIQTRALEDHFSVVEIFCGHGIGRSLHEAPLILHYVPRNPRELKKLDCELKEGMVFTIEPILTAGQGELSILSDGWTAVTKDRSLSAQWEHTIAVTSDGYDVLSIRYEELAWLEKVKGDG